MCLDEGRITNKSRRNIYKTRNPDKPIRMGWTVNKLADKGELGGYFDYNHLTKVGKYSYTICRKEKITTLSINSYQKSRVWERRL